MKEVRRPLCQHGGEEHFRNRNTRTEEAQIGSMLGKSEEQRSDQCGSGGFSEGENGGNEGDIGLCLPLKQL